MTSETLAINHVGTGSKCAYMYEFRPDTDEIKTKENEPAI